MTEVLHPPVTKILSEFIVGHASRGWSDECELAGHRTVLNWMACAIGAAGHPTVDAAVSALSLFEPARQVCLFGRRERLDMGSAAMVNGISSHVFDFDDTIASNLVHPAGPVVASAFALAEHFGLSGRQVIDAVVIGVDVSSRVANLVYPEHYDRGWHITGSAGVLGAAAASARLLKLDQVQTAAALGLAASQPIGLREQFGTMGKPFHPGAAARAGLTAALFAGQGFTASATAIEGKRGFARVLSTVQHWNAALDGLGERFEIMQNMYKPYACGLVIHPCIDGCLSLVVDHGLRPSDIESVEMRVHPLVIELTGKTAPVTGLEGKFSVYHGCAAAIVHGRAGEAEFHERVVNQPEVMAMRSRINATADDAVAQESAVVEFVCTDGRRLSQTVHHALGTLARPTGDAQLDAKFDGLVAPVVGREKARRLLSSCRSLGALTTLEPLVVDAVNN